MKNESQELLQKALALPEEERAELAGNLLAGLDSTINENVDAAWQAEVAGRSHEVASGKVGTVAWDEVQRKVRALPDADET